MTIQAFKLPRRSLYKDPRKAARSILKNAARPVEAKEPVDPLKDWDPGFSHRAAIDYFEAENLRFPDQPSNPSMPEDITNITSEELGTLYAQYVAYTEFLEGRLAEAEILSDEDAAHLLHVEAEIHLRKTGTVSDKKSKTIQDPRYVQHEMRALSSKAKAKLLRARVKGYERCANALSREMTRRQPKLTWQD